MKIYSEYLLDKYLFNIDYAFDRDIYKFIKKNLNKAVEEGFSIDINICRDSRRLPEIESKLSYLRRIHTIQIEHIDSERFLWKFEPNIIKDKKELTEIYVCIPIDKKLLNKVIIGYEETYPYLKNFIPDFN